MPVRSPRRSDLRAITLDGICFSVMVGLGETYLPAFALAVGMGAVAAGLLATLPMLAGAFLQLLTPLGVRALRSYRRWVVLCAGLQAASFAPLVWGAASGQIAPVWIAGSAVAYWAFGMATSPAWNAWVGGLVPPRVRARFFARRTRAAHASLFTAILVGGFALELGAERGSSAPVFAALFAGAALARLASAHFLSSQRELPGQAARHRTLGAAGVWRAIQTAHSGRVLGYLLGMQAGVHLAAPYFTPYMLEELALSYGQFVALTGAAFAARVAVLPALGRLAQRRGTRGLLYLGAFGVIPLPVLWLVSHDFVYLLLLQLLAGATWAALELATLLSFFDRIGESERASVLTGFNLANALAIALGSVAGGWILSALDGASEGYAALFVLSTLARLGMLFVVGGVEPAARLLRMQLRTLAVRPSAGAVERPILASLDEDGAPAREVAE